MKPLSFSNAQRLATKAEFKAIFDKSYKVTSPYLLALYNPNQLGTARIGIIIGKRIAKKAVVRHGFKRIIRESFRLNQLALMGFDIIIMARANSDKLTKIHLREGIELLWLQLLKRSQRVSAA